MNVNFEHHKRLKVMLMEEMKVEQLETQTVKYLAKLDNSLTECVKKTKQQRCEFDKLNSQLMQRNKDIQNRYQVNQIVHEQLTEAAANNAAMQAQLTKKKQERNEQMGCVRILSEATNTYINQKALPHEIKGVTVLQDKGQWIPFNFAADEVHNLGSLWKQLHSCNANAKKWQELMTVSNTPVDKNDGNLTDPSIVLVDLTSPQSSK